MKVASNRDVRAGMAIVALLALFGVAVAISQENFLLFHTIAEGFSITVAVAIFILAWNTRELLDNDYLLFVGIAYLFVAVLDSAHTLSYKGMGIFPGDDPNPATQLWIAARYVEAGVLLLAPTFILRRVRPWLSMGVFAVVTAAILASVFAFDAFPTAFVDGQGLTAFKIGSEYAIMGLLLAALARLYGVREQFAPRVFALLSVAIVLTVASEAAFTLYESVFAIENVVGHLLKVGSFAAVYQAVVVTGLRRPQEILYRDLAAREASEHRVAEVLQDAMFSEVPFTFGFTIATAHRAGSQIARIGGDFYDFFADRERIVVIIGDVAGRGLGAATMTTIAKRTIRAFTHQDPSPGTVLDQANRVLLQDLDDERFVTVAYAAVDRETGSATIALAGHPEPLLIDGETCVPVDVLGGLPLGLFDQARYETSSVSMGTGQVLVLYTDGLVEARRDGRQWGEEGLCRHLGENAHLPLKELLESAMDAAAEFAGGELGDDAALVALRRDELQQSS